MRERVVAAVAGGLSRRAAARQFKVSANSAICWMDSLAKRGLCAAKPMGGDMRSRPLKAYRDWLPALVKQEPDLTLEEIRGRLATERSFKANPSMLWRFFDRYWISFKKLWMLPSRTIMTSPPNVGLARGTACNRSQTAYLY